MRAALRLLATKGIDTAPFRSKSWLELTGPDAPEIDLAITYGTGPGDASAYFVRPLPTLQFFPVCSPGLFNQQPLKHPRIWPATACCTTTRTARPGPPG